VFVLNVMLFEMRADSCARNITLDWIGLGLVLRLGSV